MLLSRPYRYLSLLIVSVLLASCHAHYNIRSTRTERHVIVMDSAHVPVDDPEAIATLQPYKVKIDSMMNQVLAYSKRPLIKDLPEGLLNNFIADIILQKGREYYKSTDGATVDMCLLNNGGLRSTLPKGAITKNSVFQLMPFENKMIVITITGDNAAKLFNSIAKKGGMPVAGIKMGIQGDTATNILIGGKPFDRKQNVRIVTSDYLADGGDDFGFFSKPIEYKLLEPKIRDAIIEYLLEESAKGNEVDGVLDKRIYYEK